jgi:hypothetical protein
MKILFLLIGIIAGTAVRAQQNDLFNIEEHLKKKMAEAFTLPSLPPSVVPVNNQAQITVMPVQPLSFTLPNQDMVYYGNGTMPCVVPDMKQFNTTYNPVAGNKKLLTGPMPNGAAGD